MKRYRLKKKVIVILFLIPVIICLLLLIFNRSKSLVCVYKPDKYVFKLNDSVTLKFKKDKLIYKKEVIQMDYTESELDNDTFLSYVNTFKDNKKQYEIEGWSYKVIVNKRKITLKIVGDQDVSEIKKDNNNYDYYKNYYEELNYKCK